MSRHHNPTGLMRYWRAFTTGQRIQFLAIILITTILLPFIVIIHGIRTIYNYAVDHWFHPITETTNAINTQSLDPPHPSCNHHRSAHPSDMDVEIDRDNPDPFTERLCRSIRRRYMVN